MTEPTPPKSSAPKKTGSTKPPAPSDRPPVPPKLTEAEIAAALKAVPDWSEAGGLIQRTFHFKDFLASMAFVAEVAKLAEAAQHHPDILIRYNRVTLSVNTHDAGGITVKDFDLAKKCDALVRGAT